MTFDSWDDPVAADDLFTAALFDAVAVLAAHPQLPAQLREENLRSALRTALDTRLPGHVRAERKLELKAFQGVGGFDLLVDRVPERRVAWLVETKWSYTSRPKIFEGAWDAVKLCLAQAAHSIKRTWLVTGAPAQQWREAECVDLFETGSISVADMWARALVPPGPNGGATVGEDLITGGHGKVFTSAPDRLNVQALDPFDLPSAG